MARGSLAATALIVLCLVAPSASARTDAPALTKPQAVAAVRAVIRAKASVCGLRIVRITATRSGRSWRVAATTSGRTTGVSRWSVARKPAPLQPAGSPDRVRLPAPTKPPPVPSEPPPPAPGAPATYAFGSGLTPAQQAFVRRGLDAGASLYRSTLGRELPAFGRGCTPTSRPWSRVCGEQADVSGGAPAMVGRPVGHAQTRKVWLGRDGSRPPVSAPEDCGTRGIPSNAVRACRPARPERLEPGRIPPAGPWWLPKAGRVLRLPRRRRRRRGALGTSALSGCATRASTATLVPSRPSAGSGRPRVRTTSTRSPPSCCCATAIRS